MKEIVLLLLLSTSVIAAETIYEFENDIQSKRFYRLTSSLRCMVCQNESLDASQSELAIDLKNHIYDLLKSDLSDAEIKANLVARYGEVILYQPPINQTTMLLWLFPLLCLAAGFVFLFTMARRS